MADTCTAPHCAEKALPGLVKGSGLCAYHWAKAQWGREWADKCYPNHPETLKAANSPPTTTRPPSNR